MAGSHQFFSFLFLILLSLSTLSVFGAKLEQVEASTEPSVEEAKLDKSSSEDAEIELVTVKTSTKTIKIGNKEKDTKSDQDKDPQEDFLNLKVQKPSKKTDKGAAKLIDQNSEENSDTNKLQATSPEKEATDKKIKEKDNQENQFYYEVPTTPQPTTTPAPVIEDERCYHPQVITEDVTRLSNLTRSSITRYLRHSTNSTFPYAYYEEDQELLNVYSRRIERPFPYLITLYTVLAPQSICQDCLVEAPLERETLLIRDRKCEKTGIYQLCTVQTVDHNPQDSRAPMILRVKHCSRFGYEFITLDKVRCRETWK